jgi:polar amino acid transport system substrate-binding protein
MHNHKKLFVLLPGLVLVLAMALPVAAAPDASPLRQVEGQTVKIGVNAEYPPFESVDENGNIVGFDADLMSAIAADAGFEVEWVNTRWDGIFTALAQGEFDAVISAATITAEREQEVDFSVPYFNAGQIISVRVADAENIVTPDDLAGKRVGVQTATTGDIYATDIPGVEVQRYDEVTLAFQALGNGEVDAVIADSPTSADIIANNPDLNLTIVGDPLTEEYYGVAVRPDFPELLDAINISLVNVINEGAYAEIYESYFGVQPATAFQAGSKGVVDRTDPESVIAYMLDRFTAGDVGTLVGVICEGEVPTEADLADYTDFTIDLSGLVYEASVEGAVAMVTVTGTYTIDGRELDAAQIFPEPFRLVQKGTSWIRCNGELSPEATPESSG